MFVDKKVGCLLIALSPCLLGPIFYIGSRYKIDQKPEVSQVQQSVPKQTQKSVTDDFLSTYREEFEILKTTKENRQSIQHIVQINMVVCIENLDPNFVIKLHRYLSNIYQNENQPYNRTRLYVTYIDNKDVLFWIDRINWKESNGHLGPHKISNGTIVDPTIDEVNSRIRYQNTVSNGLYYNDWGLIFNKYYNESHSDKINGNAFFISDNPTSLKNENDVRPNEVNIKTLKGFLKIE